MSGGGAVRLGVSDHPLPGIAPPFSNRGQRGFDHIAAVYFASAPTGLTVDGDDYRRDWDRHECMQRFYCDARLQLVAGAGHVVHLERSERFNRAVDL